MLCCWGCSVPTVMPSIIRPGRPSTGRNHVPVQRRTAVFDLYYRMCTHSHTGTWILILSLSFVHDLKLEVHSGAPQIRPPDAAASRLCGLPSSHSVSQSVALAFARGPQIAWPSRVRSPMWSVPPAGPKKHTDLGLQVTERGRIKENVLLIPASVNFMYWNAKKCKYEISV